MQKTGNYAKMLFSILLSASLIFNNTGITVFAEESGAEAVVKDSDESEEFLDSTGMSEMDMLETNITETDTFGTDMPEENADIEDSQQEENGGLTESTESVQSETESVIESEKSAETIADEREGSCETEIHSEEDSQPELKDGEFTGVYQFGDAPSKEDNVSALYSVRTAIDDNAAELEAYLYQQMKNRNESIYVGDYEIRVEDIGKVFAGIINEHPELYFVNKRYQYYSNNVIVTEIVLTYNDSLDDNAFQMAQKEALAVVSADMSDLEKAIVLHDYLAVNCEYDEKAIGNTLSVSHSAYGALANRIAVCDGYALAYKYLLNQVGIDCYMVVSDAMSHAWNLIVLDGEYYQVDVTWDDPTEDLTGRACHQYMFRSDDAFVKECGHYDWWITKGVEVVDYKATDTSYDMAFWLNSEAPLVLSGKDCYYIRDYGINKTNLSDITETGERICYIGWYNSGLFRMGNRLYYNDASSIYSIAIDDSEGGIGKRKKFTADTTEGCIYGLAFCQGKVLYALGETNGSIYVADFSFGNEVPVEKIELNQKTLELNAGDTAVLKSSVTPDNIADICIVWESSDVSVAQVKNGTVKAISVGNCTITVTAGGRKATCEVSVKGVIARGEYEDIIWKLDLDGKLIVTGTGEIASTDSTDYSRAPWYYKGDSIISAEINVSNMKNASYMFNGCDNLQTLDLSNFDTKNVTDMSNIFYGCKNLKTLDLSNLDTGNVTDMSNMFYGCSSLGTLDLSNLDTGNVTDMSSIFYGCSSLQTLDLSNFDTGNVTDMGNMFYGCSNLGTLDLSNFDTGNVIDMSYMFNRCSNLEILDLSKFDTKNVTSMKNMFEWCTNLGSLDLSNFNTGNVTDTNRMFAYCSNLNSLDMSNFDIRNVINMGGMFEGCENLDILDLSNFDTGNITTSMSYLLYSCNKLKTIYTPYNLKKHVPLPGGTWYQPDGTAIQELPQNLDYSIAITRKRISESGVPVEKIELNKETLELIVGNTTILEAIVTPENATDADIIWNSSDASVAQVEEDGTVIARGAGNCTITATVGGKQAVCDVTVIEKEEGVIASGIDYDITWKIDADGKLTASGTGDFSASFQAGSRVPWFNYCSDIITAEINIKGMSNAAYMFCNCSNLTNIDLSGFDTRNVTDMSHMFYNCSNLTDIDLSGFDTSKVTNMGSMFNGCTGLASIDVSDFDTSNATNMKDMFNGCINLTSIDLSGFDTQNVTNIRNMFYGCWRLNCLDLSSFDLSKVTDTDGMLGGANYMGTIYTPYNLTQSVELPYGDWYQPDGTVITELPKNLGHSIIIKLGSVPEISEPYIEASKNVTVYTCGTSVNLDDLTVRYFDTDGSVKRLSESEYTTNVSELDMTTAGEKTLVITYHTGMKILTAEITLTVEDGTLQITGIRAEKETAYNGMPVCIGTAAVKKADGTDITNRVKLIYTYTGKQADGSAYQSTTTAPTNAGTYNLTVSIAENATGYTGNVAYDFEITKASLTITARDMSIKSGAPLPSTEDYKYDIAGLMAGDRIITAPICTCSIMDTSKAGEYEILISGADAGMNYEITNKNGTLTVNETGETAPYYAVTFDLLGKGSNILNTGVKEGSLLERPQDPKWNEYIFTGWYKNKDCTALWDFASDTVRSDTILYAGWIEDKDESPYLEKERTDLEAENLNCTIADIRAKVYDGTAYEPAVKVTAMVNGKKTTLTEGADYRVFYKDNISAGIGTVIVRGCGLYSGKMVKNFTISPKPVKKLKVITGSIAGSVSEMKVSQLPVYVYDGTKLLNSGAGYMLSDLQPVRNGAQVKVTGQGNYEGSVIAKLIVYESGTQLIAPENITLHPENEMGDYVYTGKAIKPDVTVKAGGITLTKKEYKVQYQNNKNAGTAYVIVTGKGAYKGKVVIPFTIRGETEESTSGGFVIKEISSKTYNGKLQKPSVSVTIQKDGKTKKLSKKDYTVTYQNNFHSGWTWDDEAPTVIVTGKGNYAGMTAITKFNIEPLEIGKASLKGTQGNLVLTYRNRKLKEGVDYKIFEYSLPDKNNKVEVTIIGMGDFTDVMMKSVKVQ